MELTLEQLTAWLGRYFHAWQSNDPAEVAALFDEHAVYYYGPFRPPARGRSAIVENWVSDPAQQTDIEYEYKPLAVHGDLGVAHWHVSFRPALQPDERVELDGILLLRFAPSLLCIEHREWYAEHTGSANSP